MKLYKFYKVDRDYVGTPPILYAYTDDKTLADIFISDRKTSMFEMVTSKLNKSEYLKVKSTYGNYQLGLRGYHTKPTPDSPFMVVVRVVSTSLEEEKSCLYSDDIIKELGKHLFSPKMFTSKYLIALQTVKFIDFYTFYKCGFVDDYDYFFSGASNYDSATGLDLKIDFDELGIFLMKYGNTFKEVKNKADFK